MGPYADVRDLVEADGAMLDDDERRRLWYHHYRLNLADERERGMLP